MGLQGTVPITFYLCLSLALFALGVAGVIIRKNMIVVLMCIELMLNAVNITFVTFSRAHGSLEGQVVVFFAMAVAAAEAAVGLAIALTLFRGYRSIETGEVDELRL